MPEQTQMPCEETEMPLHFSEFRPTFACWAFHEFLFKSSIIDLFSMKDEEFGREMVFLGVVLKVW